MMHEDQYHLPREWGTDPISHFFEQARQNTIAAYTRFRGHFNLLSEIDGIYVTLIDNLNQRPDFLPCLFLTRTHCFYRSALRLALPGQLAESYMVLRGCLESTMYGLYVDGDVIRQEIWIKRHEDVASRKRAKDAFTIRKVTDHLNTIDDSLQGRMKALYNRTIDLGGHPNERAIMSQTRITIERSRRNFATNYFQCGDITHEVALKSACEVGICCLEVFYHVFRVRYQLLQLDERLDRVRERV